MGADLAEVEQAIEAWLTVLRGCRTAFAALRASLHVPAEEEISEMGESRPWDLATWIAGALDCAVEESLASAIAYLERAVAETQEGLDREWREARGAQGSAEPGGAAG